MDLSVFEKLFSAFDSQEQAYGLLFGYTLDKSIHLTSFLAPASLQSFSEEKTDDQKDALIDLLEDLHNSVSGLRLLGIISKHSESITQQALTMKAQECFTGLSNRQFKSPFYFVYMQASLAKVFEKTQGEVFKSIPFTEIKLENVTPVNTLARLKLSRSFNQKQAKDTSLPDFITAEAQKYLSSLETNTHILVNSVLVSNPKRSLSEITHQSNVDFEFLCEANDELHSQDLQREATQIYFEEASIQLKVRVSKAITLGQLKTVLIGGIQKELESRIYQIFADPSVPKSIRDVTRSLQMPIKLVSTSFDNMHIVAYVSHKSLKQYGSCIYASKEAAEKYWASEFPSKKEIAFALTDDFANDSTTTQSQDNQQAQQTNKNSNNKSQSQDPHKKDQSAATHDNQMKAKISYVVFSLAIAIMAYVFMKI